MNLIHIVNYFSLLCQKILLFSGQIFTESFGYRELKSISSGKYLSYSLRTTADQLPFNTYSRYTGSRHLYRGSMFSISLKAR